MLLKSVSIILLALFICGCKPDISSESLDYIDDIRHKIETSNSNFITSTRNDEDNNMIYVLLRYFGVDSFLGDPSRFLDNDYVNNKSHFYKSILELLTNEYLSEELLLSIRNPEIIDSSSELYEWFLNNSELLNDLHLELLQSKNIILPVYHIDEKNNILKVTINFELMMFLSNSIIYNAFINNKSSDQIISDLEPLLHYIKIFSESNYAYSILLYYRNVDLYLNIVEYIMQGNVSSYENELLLSKLNTLKYYLGINGDQSISYLTSLYLTDLLIGGIPSGKYWKAENVDNKIVAELLYEKISFSGIMKTDNLNKFIETEISSVKDLTLVDELLIKVSNDYSNTTLVNFYYIEYLTFILRNNNTNNRLNNRLDRLLTEIAQK